MTPGITLSPVLASSSNVCGVLHCSTVRKVHKKTAHQIELLDAAVQEDAQEVTPGLGAAGTCQVPGDFMCASKGLQLVRVELNSSLSTVFCLMTLQAAGPYGASLQLEALCFYLCFMCPFCSERHNDPCR